jgi:hypothetical protein
VRGCGAVASKTYSSAADAERYALALGREDREDLGRRAPLVALFPFRLARRRRPPEAGGGTKRDQANGPVA